MNGRSAEGGVLAKHRTKADTIHAHLREQILSGELEPEERLTLAALSQRLGTSIIPIREALTRLEREGLVEVMPYRAVRVAAMSIADISELFSVRAVLEGHAARLAAEREGERLANELEAINARFQAAAVRKDFAEVSVANWEFHRHMLDRAGNLRLGRILEDVWSQCERYRAGFRLIPGRDVSAVTEHGQIIAAIRASELDGVEAAVRLHIEKAGTEMIAYLEAEDQKAAAL